MTTKKAKKTKQKNREGDEDDLQVEAKEFAFEAYQDPSLSPAQVVIIVQQLETESARAVAQQQLWSLDTSCAIAALAELELTMVSVPKDGNCQPNLKLSACFSSRQRINVSPPMQMCVRLSQSL